MAFKTAILSLAQRDRWRAALARASGGEEPCFQPAFYAAAESPSAEAECFVFEEGGEVAVYPYLRRRLRALSYLGPESALCDLTGGYGYNGAVSSAESPAFLRRFREAFNAHCERTGVLTEFVRFHPLLRNERYFASDCAVTAQNKNIALDLRRPLPEIRARYAHNCRKNLKKAAREGVRVFVEEGLGPRFPEFLRVYARTMRRVEAGADYGFGRAYFERLLSELEPRPIVAYAELHGRIVSCELALRSERIIYSYLGGTEEDAFASRPNNALKDEIIRWAHERGCRWCLLGGGLKPDDGIFRYKRGFAPDGVLDFFVGRRVYDEQAYESVLRRWLSAGPRDAADTRLQRYWS